MFSISLSIILALILMISMYMDHLPKTPRLIKTSYYIDYVVLAISVLLITSLIIGK